VATRQAHTACVKRWSKKTAVALGVAFASVGLSGCGGADFCGPSQIINFLFCNYSGLPFFGEGSAPGGPSRSHGARANAAAAPAAVGLAFTATLSAAPVAGAPGTQTQSGDVHALRGALLSGSFGGKVPAVRGERRQKARALVRAVLKATWRGRVDGTVDAKTGARHADILALATLPRRRGQRRADRACLRIAITGATGRQATGTFSLHGATGATRKLSLSGAFAFASGKAGSIAGTARVTTRAPRALSASCRALAA
jgi:hypothetical protein